MDFLPIIIWFYTSLLLYLYHILKYFIWCYYKSWDFFTKIYVRNTKLTGSEISNSFLSSASLSSCNIWQSDIMGTHSSLIRIRHKKNRSWRGEREGEEVILKLNANPPVTLLCVNCCVAITLPIYRGGTLSLLHSPHQHLSTLRSKNSLTKRFKDNLVAGLVLKSWTNKQQKQGNSSKIFSSLNPET